MLAAGLQASLQPRYLYPLKVPPQNQLLHQRLVPGWRGCGLSSAAYVHLSISFHPLPLHLGVVLNTLASVSEHSPSNSCKWHNSRPDSKLRHPRSKSTNHCSKQVGILECSHPSHNLYIQVGKIDHRRSRAKKSTSSYNHSYNILGSNMGMNMSFLLHYILIL